MSTTPPTTLQHELLRVWSDPLPHAHAQWWKDEPPDLLRRAVGCRAGRDVLTRRLRERVPLPTLGTVVDTPRAAWAMTNSRRLASLFDHAGFLLMRGWMARAVGRADQAAVIGFVGRAQYDRLLRDGSDLWSPHAWRPAPHYGIGNRGLNNLFRSLGFAAIDQTLAQMSQALRGRVRLVAGPQPPLADAPPVLGFDAPALLEHVVEWTTVRPNP
jgi:hypothetical protein